MWYWLTLLRGWEPIFPIWAWDWGRRILPSSHWNKRMWEWVNDDEKKTREWSRWDGYLGMLTCRSWTLKFERSELAHDLNSHASIKRLKPSHKASETFHKASTEGFPHLRNCAYVNLIQINLLLKHYIPSWGFIILYTYCSEVPSPVYPCALFQYSRPPKLCVH
jgi:hypothetical protein